MVFHGVVRQRGNGLILVAAVLRHQRADAQQVADIGNLGSLAELRVMQCRSEVKGFIKAATE